MNLDTTAFTEHVTPNGAIYYHLKIDLPPAIRSVQYAWLELQLDVSSQDLNDVQDPAPTFEVYALKEPLGENLTREMLEHTRLPMSRPIAIGTDRTARCDISEMIQRLKAAPSENHGLIFGSITDGNRGVFSLKPGESPGAIVIVGDE